MKIQIIIFSILLSLSIFSQNAISMEEVEQRQERSMSEVTGKTIKGKYRYFVKGESTPYTGVLYAKYPNGNLNSWQEYVDGIGQGKWINYYENGNYKEIGYYEQNLVQGPISKFHPNGVLKARGQYKDWRIRVGEWKYYDEAGQLIRTENYGEKGNIEEVQAYYDRGDISYAWYASILSENGFEVK